MDSYDCKIGEKSYTIQGLPEGATIEMDKGILRVKTLKEFTKATLQLSV
jgi:hypothetical protein